MSASPLMTLGVRALAANYAALQTVGHNIANANVAGYSRQQVELKTAQGQFTGAGFFGKGVDVATVSRTHDAFLTREAVSTRSVAAMDAARLTQLGALERVFKTGEEGIGHAVSSFLNAFGELGGRPADQASRQVVLLRAEELAARFADAGRQFVTAQRAVGEELRAGVAEVNTLARSIALSNQAITSAQGTGQAPNDLLDERDRLIARLSEKIQVTTLPSDDGSVGVFIGGGQRLVLGATAHPLQVIADPDDPSRSAIAMAEKGTPRALDARLLGGGSLAGLLRFQNSDLVDARTLLGQLAAAIAGAVNEQHKLGMDLGHPPGSGRALFAELADLAADAVRPAAANLRDAEGRFAATPTLQVVDASRLQASEYELAAVTEDGVVSWQLRRLSDDRRFTLQPGVVVDGLHVDLGDPPPAATDRFLLQPVSRAADRMAVLLRDPRELAAASPLSAAVASANTGTMAVDALTVTADGADPQLTAVIGFSSDDGDYGWELRDRDSDALVASGSGRWRAGEPIPSAPDADINGFSLRISGVPRSGDSLTVERTLYPAVNNGNAQALAALRDALSVAQTSGGALSFNEAYAGALAEVGVRVQGARSAAGISGAVAAQAETQRAQGSGVNLDEEAARLIQYQQSYQAAAKVLQIAQQVFDLLLDVAAGR